MRFRQTRPGERRTDLSRHALWRGGSGQGLRQGAGLFSASTSDIIADLGALRDLGVSAVDIDFEYRDPEASIAAMRRFKDEVLSRL
jgi:hypothetical protein